MALPAAILYCMKILIINGLTSFHAKTSKRELPLPRAQNDDGRLEAGRRLRTDQLF
jgi:hypothetical protein